MEDTAADKTSATAWLHGNASIYICQATCHSLPCNMTLPDMHHDIACHATSPSKVDGIPQIGLEFVNHFAHLASGACAWEESHVSKTLLQPILGMNITATLQPTSLRFTTLRSNHILYDTMHCNHCFADVVQTLCMVWPTSAGFHTPAAQHNAAQQLCPLWC